jgi:hypothetical protein
MLLPVSVARHSLDQLRAKYREMLSMRLAHESGDEDEAAVRNRMAELASRFPGSLREIDDLELDVIRDRMNRLDSVLRGDHPIEPWMEAVALFHALARGALWAKRWLAGRKAVDSSVRGKYETDASSAGVGGEALVWAEELAAIAAPPRGRVMDLVFTRVAVRLGTTEDEARALVFGSSRSQRLRIIR